MSDADFAFQTPADKSSRRLAPRRLVGFVLSAGLLAGVLAGVGGELIHGRLAPTSLPPLSDPFSNAHALLFLAAESREASLAFQILGALTGLALGVAGGLARGSKKQAVIAGSAGMALGVVAALVAARLVMPTADANRGVMVDDMALSIKLLAGFWMPIGFAAGLALAFGLAGDGGVRDDKGHWLPLILRCTIGGLLGAGVGTGLYLLVGELAMPMSQSGSTLPTTATARIFARACVALGTAALACVALPTLHFKDDAPPAPEPAAEA